MDASASNDPHIPADVDFRNGRIWPIPVGELTRLSPTTDAARFYRFDAIKAAEDCGTMPTSGFRPTSNNVKRPMNGRKAAKAGLGVSGGYVEGRDDGDYEHPIVSKRALPTIPIDAPRKGHGSGKSRRRGKVRTSDFARYYR